MSGDTPCKKTSPNQLRVASFFSGVGGLDYAFHKDKKFKVVSHSEIDKHPSAVLEYLHPNVPNNGDIVESVRRGDYSYKCADIVIGGFPCTDISIQGNMKGIKKGKKSSLFDVMNLAIDIIRPDYVLVENVKNLLSKKMEKDYNHVKRSLKELGYQTKTFELDSSKFGTPQQRVRVFIFAVHRSVKVRKDNIVYEFQKIQNRKAKAIKWPFKKGQRVISWSKSHRTKTIYGDDGEVLRVEKHIGLRIKQGNLINTLTTGDGCRGASTGTMVVEGNKVRLLTPDECESLMMYAKGHTEFGMYKGVKKVVNKTARYKMCGNSVVSTCSIPFMEMIKALEKNRKPSNEKEFKLEDIVDKGFDIPYRENVI